MSGDPRSEPARPLPGRRLLVVEDDQVFRAALSLGLQLHGYEIAAVCNGIEALEAVARMVPDLVVLDLSMQGMSGQRFVEELTCPWTTSASDWFVRHFST